MSALLTGLGEAAILGTEMKLLHILARLIMSLGLAVQASRLASGSDRFHRMVRITLWPAIGIVAALAIGLNGYRALQEENAGVAPVRS